MSQSNFGLARRCIIAFGTFVFAELTKIKPKNLAEESASYGVASTVGVDFGGF